MNPVDAQSGSPTQLEPREWCRLCGREFAERKRRSINGFGVCKKCHTAFVNRRQAAFLIDYLLYIVTVQLAGIGLRTWLPSLSFVGDEELIVALAGIFPFAMKDGFAGYSPGKWLMGVQVINMATRQPAGFLQSFKRNIHLSIPCFQWLGILAIGFGSWRGRRWGDRWAGTMVVWCKHADKLPFNPCGTVCVHCGYDLTGNVSGTCPECGTRIPEETWRRIGV